MKGSLVLLIVASLIMVSCTPAVSLQKVCQMDQDCVPAQCCHAVDAVNKDNAPDCSNKLCTLDCAPGSIDCGQGSVVCVKGACKVVII